MGKKDQFINKQKAITFKLAYRDNEDPYYSKDNTNTNISDRVFEIKSMPNRNMLKPEE